MTIKITIPSSEWVNVTALSGVSAGAAFNITNQGSRVLLLAQDHRNRGQSKIPA